MGSLLLAVSFEAAFSAFSNKDVEADSLFGNTYEFCSDNPSFTLEGGATLLNALVFLLRFSPNFAMDSLSLVVSFEATFEVAFSDKDVEASDLVGNTLEFRLDEPSFTLEGGAT